MTAVGEVPEVAGPERRLARGMDCRGRVRGTRGTQHFLDLAQPCEKLPDIRQLLKAAAPAMTTPAKLKPAASLTS